MLAKILLSLTLTANIFAKYTIANRELQPDDVMAAGRVYDEIERRVRTEAFNVIQADIDAQRAVIEEPFEKRIEEMHSRTMPLREVISGVEQELYTFQKEHRQRFYVIDTERDQALLECDERFNREIATRLAPVRGALDDLSKEEQKLNKIYNDFRSKHPRAYDEYDDMDWGFRLEGIERRRKELIDTNCGNLFTEKNAARKVIEERFEAIKAEHTVMGATRNSEFARELERLKAELEPMERVSSTIYDEMYTEVRRVFAERGVDKMLVAQLTADTTALLPNFFEELIRRDGVAATATN